MINQIETFIKHKDESFKLVTIKEGSTFKAFKINGSFERNYNKIEFQSNEVPILIETKNGLRSLNNFHIRLMKQIYQAYHLKQLD